MGELTNITEVNERIELVVLPALDYYEGDECYTPKGRAILREQDAREWEIDHRKHARMILVDGHLYSTLADLPNDEARALVDQHYARRRKFELESRFWSSIGDSSVINVIVHTPFLRGILESLSNLVPLAPLRRVLDGHEIIPQLVPVREGKSTRSNRR